MPLDRLTFAYDLLVSELAVDLVEPKLFTSPTADSSQKLLAPCVHNLVSIRKINVAGDVSWIIEMDEKKLMPIRGKAHLTYRGQVENVQFVVAIASICLAKEVILVGKSAGDTLTELRSHPSVPLVSGALYLSNRLEFRRRPLQGRMSRSRPSRATLDSRRGMRRSTT